MVDEGEPSGDDDPAGGETGAADFETAVGGDAMVLAAATASVPGERVPVLVRTVGVHLRGERAAYRRRYERFGDDDGAEAFLVPDDRWAAVGAALGLDDREVDAVRRAHEAHARRRARDTGREEALEAALDIRSVVVIGATAD